jgi:hypothetical protein
MRHGRKTIKKISKACSAKKCDFSLMDEKSGFFAKLAQKYSEIFAAETRSKLSLEGEKIICQ